MGHSVTFSTSSYPMDKSPPGSVSNWYGECKEADALTTTTVTTTATTAPEVTTREITMTMITIVVMEATTRAPTAEGTSNITGKSKLEIFCCCELSKTREYYEKEQIVINVLVNFYQLSFWRLPDSARFLNFDRPRSEFLHSIKHLLKYARSSFGHITESNLYLQILN